MKWLSVYSPRFVATLVYMLQQSEYRAVVYLKWLLRVGDFNKVSYRGQLVRTLIVKCFLVAGYGVLLTGYVTGIYLLVGGASSGQTSNALFGGGLLLFTPILVSLLLALIALAGRALIIGPLRRRQNNQARAIFARHKGVKIAVAGSFGKTTMKEILATVLATGKRVAATEGNLNTAVAHYQFARELAGDEEVLIIEFGEYLPGDITGFCRVVDPQIGIIAGLNEAHLENFGTLERLGGEILTLKEHVGPAKAYLNGDSTKLIAQAGSGKTYSASGADGLKVSDVKVSATGLSFTLKEGNTKLNVTSGLLGRHNIGPLALAAHLGLELGLSVKQVEQGLAETKPFEHRLEPKQLPGGVQLIDDTYNGNIDGIRAGTELLKELKAERKIYVTPGLVEQGAQTESIHRELGRLVAPVADKVVLVQNSVTEHIKAGLEEAGFKGELVEINDPLKFYQNLSHVSAAGDVILMQNDWPDVYS